jgi:Putative transposase/Transposase zinc-binding domain
MSETTLTLTTSLKTATLAVTAPGDVAQSSADSPLTIGDIFRRYGPAYRRKHADRMPAQQLRVMYLLERCRTGELGSALYQCTACGRQHMVHRSCGNRHCPQCQGHKARQWFERQLDRLLPCPYFLMTFTVPKQLRRVIRRNPRECLPALFAASAATLRKLARNPKYVGSDDVGFTGVLHTWGRTLVYHPHVHYLVPGGAIGADGQSWLPSRADFFVPVKAASRIFRAQFRQLLQKHGLLGHVPKAVWRQRWVVHCLAVGDGRSSLRYLAPYVYRVAIGNRRIVRCEPGPDGWGRVTFTYRQKGTNHTRTMTVTAEEFIRRFLQHVLPPRFQKVRHFGFAHPRRKVDYEWLKMLVTATLNEVYVLIAAAKPLALPYRPTCPACGGPLAYVGFLTLQNWHPVYPHDTG